MTKKRITRVYQKGGRFYADLRDFSDVGGTKEALVVAAGHVGHELGKS